jgi:hypothetical protein
MCQETKICSKCKVEKPTTKEYFYGHTKVGFQSQCKICHKIANKLYQSKNKELVSKVNKKYYKVNADYITNRVKKWQNNTSGVYGLFENGECLYVGETKAINRRMSFHFTQIKNIHPSIRHKELYEVLQKHNHIIFGIIEETPNHKEREQYYINKLKPLYNA